MYSYNTTHIYINFEKVLLIMRGSRGVRGNSNFLKLSKLGLGPPPGKYIFPLDPPPPWKKKYWIRTFACINTNTVQLNIQKFYSTYQSLLHFKNVKKNLNGLCESCADALYIIYI